ncbi:MAG: hypothetical protein LC687_01430 [Actinobacteria bacterium]|nr:hypothetical protein [Actinomycetota bacterium]
MNDIVEMAAKVVGVVALVVVMLFLFSAIGAVILMWLWPLVIPNVFPGLVASGAIAGNLSFWVSFGLMFICGLLFRSSNSNSKKKD